MTTLDTLNGHTEPAPVAEPHFSPNTLRRLLRLHARASAAQDFAQMAQQMSLQFQEALAEACDEIGVEPPRGRQVEARIDWKNGTIRFEEVTQ